MPATYVKIFASLYSGSLATRGPWEALITFQQMLVLAEWDGTLDMTAEILARTTLVPLDIIKKGIEVLLKPDPDSRGKEEEGRRIVPLDPNRDWGWRIVNIERYRRRYGREDRNEYQREYMREHRKRAKESEEKKGNGGESRLDGFDQFYQAYPRHVGRAVAEKVWIKLHPDAALQGVLLNAIERQKATEQWQSGNGQFIPHPATWLNGKRWNDEIRDAASPDYSGLIKRLETKYGKDS